MSVSKGIFQPSFQKSRGVFLALKVKKKERKKLPPVRNCNSVEMKVIAGRVGVKFLIAKLSSFR